MALVRSYSLPSHCKHCYGMKNNYLLKAFSKICFGHASASSGQLWISSIDDGIDFQRGDVANEDGYFLVQVFFEHVVAISETIADILLFRVGIPAGYVIEANEIVAAFVKFSLLFERQGSKFGWREKESISFYYHNLSQKNFMKPNLWTSLRLIKWKIWAIILKIGLQK